MAQAVLLDNGGWRVKASTSSELLPQVVVSNCTAKLKGHLGLLVADDCDQVVRTQQLTFKRAAERGYITDWSVEFEVWQRIFGDRHLRAHPPAAELYLTEAPLTPQFLQDFCHEMVFEQFGFLRLLKAPAAAFAAYRYGLEQPDPARCCVVVDSGFSFTHVMPYHEDRCLVDGKQRRRSLSAEHEASPRNDDPAISPRNPPGERGRQAPDQLSEGALGLQCRHWTCT
eukprot:scaffold878_cov271-Pinguiococcus_pyrenoidosus.AAC.67